MPIAPDHPLGHLLDPATLAALRLCVGLWRGRRALGSLRLRRSSPVRGAGLAPSR